MRDEVHKFEEVGSGGSAQADAPLVDGEANGTEPASPAVTDDALRAANPQDVESLDEIERCLAGIWAEFLGLERVGVDDDFFKCGGSSLLMVLIITKTQEILGVNFPPDSAVRTFFRAPTVRTLARSIHETLTVGKHGHAFKQDEGIDVEEGTI